MEYSLRAFKIGETRAPGPLSLYMSAWDVVEWGAHFIWLAQGGGRSILINTGLPQNPADLQILNDACRQAYEDNYFPADRIWTPQQRLAEVGLEPSDIDAVLINSLGAYATGNIELFPNADVYMSRLGWTDFIAPDRPPAYRRQVIFPDATLGYLVTKGWRHVHLVGEEEEVLPGITMFWVGCHHRGSMAVSIQTKNGKVVISNSILKYENFDPGIPIGVLENIFECQDALDRIRQEADVVIPMCDSRVLERFRDGIIA